ncbi:hypothetical protein Lser_V15G11743 [Lactuca serriola]
MVVFPSCSSFKAHRLNHKNLRGILTKFTKEGGDETDARTRQGRFDFHRVVPLYSSNNAGPISISFQFDFELQIAIDFDFSFHTGDNNNKQALARTSDEITAGSLWRSEALHESLESTSHEVRNYFDVVKVLSEIELPSPSPVEATSFPLRYRLCFYIKYACECETQIVEEREIFENTASLKCRVGNIRETELKSKQREQSGSRRDATKTNITEKRRRNKISERIRTLQTLVPNCNKRHKASILGDAIEYIKFLQMQLQMVQSMGIGHMSQGLYMTMARQPSFHVPNLVDPNFTINSSIGMQHGMPQFGSYFPVNYPIFPTSFTGFRPLMLPPNEVHTRSFPWGQPRPVLYPQQLQFPSQTSQSMYSTTPSGTIIPTISSQQGGSSISGQPLYHVPVTNQGTE